MVPLDVIKAANGNQENSNISASLDIRGKKSNQNQHWRRFSDCARDEKQFYELKAAFPPGDYLLYEERPTQVYKHRLPGDEVIICKHPSAQPSGELVLR